MPQGFVVLFFLILIACLAVLLTWEYQRARRGPSLSGRKVERQVLSLPLSHADRPARSRSLDRY